MVSKEKIQELVSQFQSASKNKDFINEQNEEWVKWNYLEPLFDALGWKRSDIEKEQRVLKGRADYILKIGNEEVLVIEAKKVGTSLSEEEGRQAVSYAYHRKIKFAVLTNFKEIRVYHALSNIKNIDNNLLKFEDGAVFRLSYEQFSDQFNKLLLLSRESFEKQEIHKLLSKKDEKAARPIDESILLDLLNIRELLSKDLKKLRMQLPQPQIDEAVQVLINRLIFMRSVEDRGLENKNFLLGLIKDFNEGMLRKRFWDELLGQFKTFDTTYNSKLFTHSILEDENIFFDDNTLTKTIRILYFGSQDIQARYMFDEIPGDLLGSIYEQYLGTVLQETEKRVKLDSESGKRKKMGIYYTPSYIVDYIVKNTVGEYIKDKTIDEILEINIVDPACGSGSFLLRAYQEVCNTIEERLKKGERAKTSTFTFYNNNRLSLSQKISILTNCIYGVDLDEKAVELAQLNLLLKLLEDESKDAHKHLLPNLRENIKCGNSLIDDPKVAGDKAFNWHAQFSDVFHNGGFDVVVGNPPYVRNTELAIKDKDYFSLKYKSAYQQYDIYLLFFELGLNILRKNGILGFITPNKFMVSDYGLKLREILLNNSSILFLIDVSHLTIFKDAMTYPVITLFEKIVKDNNIKFKNVNEVKELESKDSITISQRKFMQGDNRFIYDAGNIKFEICKNIESNPKIGDLFLCQRGSPKNKIKITEKQSNSINCIISRDVDRYYSKKRGDLFVISKLQDKIIQKEKILLPRTVLRLKCTYDAGNNFIMDRIYYLIPKDKINLKYVVGLLNSKILDFYYKTNFGTTHIAGGYLDLRGVQINQIPIKLPTPQQEKILTDLVDTMLSLQKQLHESKQSGNEKELLEQQIKNTDYEIDQEVYRLYGLTKEEIKIVEDSLK